jgi:hypothetical protein
MALQIGAICGTLRASGSGRGDDRAPAHRKDPAVTHSTHRRSLLASSIALGGLLLLAAPAAAVPVGWTTPVKAFAQRNGPAHAMVLDSSGYVHMAVEGTTSIGIWYVTNAPSGTWSSRRITTSHDQDPSIAINGAGHVVIAFDRRNASGSTSYGIWLASESSGVWSATQRYSGQAFFPSVQLHSNRIAFAFMGPSNSLKYRSNLSGTWITQTVASSVCCSSAPSLRLDNTQPMIAWSKRGATGAGRLMFSLYGAGHWQTQTADANATYDPTLVLDGSTPEIVYVRPNGGTYVAIGGPGPWAHHGYGSSYIDRPDMAVGSGSALFIVEGNGQRLRLVKVSSSALGSPTYATLTSTGNDFAPEIELYGDHPRVVFDRASRTTNDGIYFTGREPVF